jgi:MFS family permease
MLLNEARHPSHRHWTILGLAWAGWLFDFYDLLLFSFLIVPIRHTLHLSVTETALSLGVSLAATAAGGVFFGWLADRIGRKPVLVLTIVTYSLGTGLCGISRGLWDLLLFRVITGFGVGGEWGTGQTLVAETFPPAMRARAASIMQTGAPCGVALAAVVGGFLQPWFAQLWDADTGWRVCFWLSAVPVLMVFIVRLRMPESDVWIALRGASPRAYVPEPCFAARLRGDTAVRRLFTLGLVLAVTDMSAYWYTYVWLPRYLYDQLGMSLAKSGSWILVTQVGGLLGYLSFGVVADWKGRRLAYSFFSLIWAGALLSVTWFWDPLAAAPGLLLTCMFFVGVGTGNFSGYGPILAELFPTSIRNSAMGTAFNIARGVQFFTPLMITWIAALPALAGHGLGAGISLGAVFALCTGLWVWVLPETRGTRITSRELLRDRNL